MATKYHYEPILLINRNDTSQVARSTPATAGPVDGGAAVQVFDLNDMPIQLASGSNGFTPYFALDDLPVARVQAGDITVVVTSIEARNAGPQAAAAQQAADAAAAAAQFSATVAERAQAAAAQSAAAAHVPTDAAVAALVNDGSSATGAAIRALLTSATSPSTQTWVGIPRLSISGAQFVAPDGRPVLLRGADTMRSEYVPSEIGLERAYIKHMATDWKGNVVMRGVATDPINAGNASYLNILDQLVDECAANNCYIVFAARSLTVNGAQYAGIPPQSAVDAMGVLGARYKERSHVMYAAQVEPNNAGGYNPTWIDIRDHTERVVDAVRKGSAPHEPIVMAPGRHYGRDIDGARTNPVRRKNVALKFHVYGKSGDSANGINWDTAFKAAINAGLPVFCGEFAVEPNLGMTQALVDELMAYFDSTNPRISWTAWLMDHQTAENMLASNVPPFPPSALGAPIRQRMLSTPPLPASGGGTTSAETPPPAALYEQAFGTDIGGWTAETNAADLRRDVTRFPDGALRWTAPAAGNSRSKSPSIVGASPNVARGVTVKLAHSDTAGRLVNLQFYGQDSTGAFKEFVAAESVTVPAASTGSTEIVVSMTPANSATTQVVLLAQFEGMGAGTFCYVDFARVV